MITAVVGAGGKTTLIHALAEQYRREGKRVFVTTSTHMFIEEDTLLTGDVSDIIRRMKQTGYVMAGLPEGKKIRSLPREVYEAVCREADEVLVEADGSKHLPIKFPIPGEPVIPENTQKIIIVCGLHALGLPAREAAFRLEAVKTCLNISEETIITPMHIQALVRKGYSEPMQNQHPETELEIHAAHDGSLYQRALAALLKADWDVTLIRKEWFDPQPVLFLCGGGHVSLELAEMASRVGFRVTVLDPRPEFSTEARFPAGTKAICDAYENLEAYLEPDSFCVVATPGHIGDETAVRAILNHPFRYLGMIGSRTKAARTRESLRASGIPEELIGAIHSPVGLPIMAQTPGEIAVSILAEMIQVKNSRSAASVSAELLACKEPGVLCIITEKHGSAPRGVGSMMLVTRDRSIDTIGGGAIELSAIRDARNEPSPALRDYHLNNTDSAGLGMICGGSCRVLFLPI